MNRLAQRFPPPQGLSKFIFALGAFCATMAVNAPAFAAVSKAPLAVIKPGEPLPANFNPVVPSRADRVDLAVGRGLGFLLEMQMPDGLINDCVKCRNYHTTASSLSAMALASAGHHPMNKTPEGLALRRVLDFTLRTDRQVPNGSFGATDQSMLYGHGITTAMLTQAMAMGLDPEKENLIRARCSMALNLILTAQSTQKLHSEDVGGWRYTPTSRTSDSTVTGWQVVALWSGRRTGFTVPPGAFRSAVGFLANCNSGGLYTYEHIDWTGQEAIEPVKGIGKFKDAAPIGLNKSFPT